jgi:membrane protein DedA with SNARE-associated domain
VHLTETQGALAYLLIVVFAMLEGEIVFTTAAILVSRGQLDAVGVAVAGAAGAALGDQFYFYLLRGRLNRLIDRFPAIARRGARLARRVRRNETLTVLALRFSPGLRIALAAACAYAGVPPLKFSLLNGFTCVVWASAILALVAWLGTSVLSRLGISGWWAVVIPALFVVILFRWIGHEEKEELESRP